MDLVQLDIAAIRQSDSQNNAYVLLLNETVGNRQLPIVIGWCEARSIAIALDGTEEPGRPLTHSAPIYLAAQRFCPNVESSPCAHRKIHGTSKTTLRHTKGQSTVMQRMD